MKKEYCYIQVDFGNGRLYHYICDDKDVKVGNCVVVSVYGEKKLAKVASVNFYTKDAVPYPINKTKHATTDIYKIEREKWLEAADNKLIEYSDIPKELNLPMTKIHRFIMTSCGRSYPCDDKDVKIGDLVVLEENETKQLARVSTIYSKINCQHFNKEAQYHSKNLDCLNKDEWLKAAEDGVIKFCEIPEKFTPDPEKGFLRVHLADEILKEYKMSRGEAIQDFLSLPRYVIICLNAAGIKSIYEFACMTEENLLSVRDINKYENASIAIDALKQCKKAIKQFANLYCIEIEKIELRDIRSALYKMRLTMEANIIVDAFRKIFSKSFSLPEKSIEYDLCYNEHQLIKDVDIENLQLSVRAHNCLLRAGINTMADFMLLTKDDLLKIRNLGLKQVDEIMQKVNDLAEKVGEVSEEQLLNAILQDAKFFEASSESLRNNEEFCKQAMLRNIEVKKYLPQELLSNSKFTQEIKEHYQHIVDEL